MIYEKCNYLLCKNRGVNFFLENRFCTASKNNFSKLELCNTILYKILR